MSLLSPLQQARTAFLSNALAQLRLRARSSSAVSVQVRSIYSAASLPKQVGQCHSTCVLHLVWADNASKAPTFFKYANNTAPKWPHTTKVSIIMLLNVWMPLVEKPSSYSAPVAEQFCHLHTIAIHTWHHMCNVLTQPAFSDLSCTSLFIPSILSSRATFLSH